MSYSHRTYGGALLGALLVLLPVSLAAQERVPTSLTPQEKAAVELSRITASDVSTWGVEPGDLAWIDAPGLPGAQIVYLLPENDGGPYVARLKFPDGYALEAHRHDNRELVTVLSGTYRLGFGSKPDRSKTVAFPAGSYVVIPAGVPHYAFMDGPTVLQVSGDGPMDFDWKLGKK